MTDAPEQPRFSVVAGGLADPDGKVVGLPRPKPKLRRAGRVPAQDTGASGISDADVVAELVRKRDSLRDEASRIAERAHALLDTAAAIELVIAAYGGDAADPDKNA
jgi:hypothetical protein